VAILAKLKLSESRYKEINVLSGGEKKRLSIAEDLLQDKQVIFLDEPTTGLDSFMAEQVIKIIHELAHT